MLIAITIGLVFLALGTYFTFLHIYCTFLRYPLHRLRGRPRETFRYVSGIPLIGPFFLVLATLALASKPALAYTAFGIALLDVAAVLVSVLMLIYILIFPGRTPEA